MVPTMKDIVQLHMVYLYRNRHAKLSIFIFFNNRDLCVHTDSQTEMTKSTMLMKNILLYVVWSARLPSVCYIVLHTVNIPFSDH